MNDKMLDQFSKNLEQAGFKVSGAWWVGDTVTFSIERNEKIDQLYNMDTDKQDTKSFYDLMPEDMQELFDNGTWRMAWGGITFNPVDSKEKHIIGYGLQLDLVK